MSPMHCVAVERGLPAPYMATEANPGFEGTCRGSGQNRRAVNAVEFREFTDQIGVAPLEHGILLARSDPATRGFAVVRVPRIGGGHAVDHPRERNEGLGVVSAAVVAQVDEDLRRATVRILEG